MQTKIELTDAEVKTRTIELVSLIREKSLKEEKRKDAAKEAQMEIDEMDTRIHQLAKEIREKARYEDAQMELSNKVRRMQPKVVGE